MSATGVAGRLARREVVRRPWRSFMVMLLVIIPVIGLTLIAVMIRTTDQTWAEEWQDRAGREDATAYLSQPEGPPVPMVTTDHGLPAFDPAVLPAGSDVLVETHWAGRVRTDDRKRMWAVITDRDLDHPISAGLVRELEGRTPQSGDEVLLTRRLARHFGVGVGDTLSLDRPSDATFTVVGIAYWGTRLDSHVVAVGSSDDPESIRHLTNIHAGQQALITFPDGFDPEPVQLIELGIVPGHNRWFPYGWDSGSGAQTAVLWTWVGGAVAFMIVGIVIAAAFAVTARRQMRLIGQLMGNGASTATLQATLFLQGTVVGLVGGAVGIAGAVGGMHLFRPVIEEIAGRRLGAFDVRLGDLLPILILATVASTVAALIPARSAVRTSVLQALAGRRPVGPYPARLVVAGAVSVACGLFLLAVATAAAGQVRVYEGTGQSNTLFILTGIAGAVALLLGTCAMAPALIARLGPLAGSLRGTARLAARSIARQRTRTGAIVAAIAVVAAGSVAGVSAWMTYDARTEANLPWRPDDRVSILYQEIIGDPDGDWSQVPSQVPSDVVDQVLAIIPDGTVFEVDEAKFSTDEAHYVSRFQVVGADTAGALGLSADMVAELEAGRAIGSASSWYGPGTPESTTMDYPIGMHDGTVVDRIELTLFPSSARLWSPGHQLLISETTALSLGMELVPGRVIIHSPSSLSGDQRDALADLGDDLLWDYQPGNSPSALHSGSVWIESPFEANPVGKLTVTAAMLAFATLLTLGVVGLGLALSAAETKDERDVLAAVGAPPRALRRLAAAKAGVLSVTGIAIGIPLGFIPLAVVVRAGSISLDAVFPTAQVALLMVVVPLIAMGATLLASAIALRMRPVTASSMAFD